MGEKPAEDYPPMPLAEVNGRGIQAVFEVDGMPGVQHLSLGEAIRAAERLPPREDAPNVA